MLLQLFKYYVTEAYRWRRHELIGGGVKGLRKVKNELGVSPPEEKFFFSVLSYSNTEMNVKYYIQAKFLRHNYAILKYLTNKTIGGPQPLAAPPAYGTEDNESDV